MRRPIRAVNAALRRLPPRPLDPEVLAEQSQKAAGLGNFGEAGALDGLSVLCGALETEAELNPLGRWIARGGVRRSLENRLRIVDAHRRFPELDAEVVRAPIVVVGPPRTGTTLLHRLLAADPMLRAPRFYEMGDPCGMPPFAPADRDRRRRRDAEQSLRFLDVALPGFRAVHDLRADAPEECVMLMGNDLVSFTYVIQYWVPSYVEWLESLDLRQAYRDHRRQIRILQHGQPARRWVLKAPAHLMGLGALLHVYPDASVIVTRRDPAVVRASTASLLAASHAISSDHADRVRLVRQVDRTLAMWAERSQCARTSAPHSATFVDVAYEDLVADPIGEVNRIRCEVGLDPGVTDDLLRSYLRSHPKDEHGPHRYPVGVER